MVKRWKCPTCNTLNCTCVGNCMLCKAKRPEQAEIVQVEVHTNKRVH